MKLHFLMILSCTSIMFAAAPKIVQLPTKNEIEEDLKKSKIEQNFIDFVGIEYLKSCASLKELLGLTADGLYGVVKNMTIPYRERTLAEPQAIQKIEHILFMMYTKYDPNARDWLQARGVLMDKDN